VMLVPLFVSYIPFGHMEEWRVFYEILPSFTVMLAQSAGIVLGYDIRKACP
jgi:hypothetical protein